MFENDDNFGLDDIVEADIKYGLFDDGTNIDDDDTCFCCGEFVEGDMKYCPYCGVKFQISKNKKYCRNISKKHVIT